MAAELLRNQQLAPNTFSILGSPPPMVILQEPGEVTTIVEIKKKTTTLPSSPHPPKMDLTYKPSQIKVTRSKMLRDQCRPLSLEL